MANPERQGPHNNVPETGGTFGQFARATNRIKTAAAAAAAAVLSACMPYPPAPSGYQPAPSAPSSDHRSCIPSVELVENSFNHVGGGFYTHLGRVAPDLPQECKSPFFYVQLWTRAYVFGTNNPNRTYRLGDAQYLYPGDAPQRFYGALETEDHGPLSPHIIMGAFLQGQAANGWTVRSREQCFAPEGCAQYGGASTDPADKPDRQ